MSKTIKVSEETWKLLDELRKKGETFDDVIVYLLDLERKAKAVFGTEQTLDR